MSWTDSALCASYGDPTLWDGPREGESALARANRQALATAICDRCPVAETCLEKAVPGLDEGVRGGEVMPECRAHGAGHDKHPPPYIEHGTEAGARAHWRRGQKACGACALAERVAKWNRQARRGRTA